ncbi:hypothetical protein EV426DRAFT_582439 [Tirmania nivea]|nr:hypothetical protein EV426DRAFT_582439 [Tirmania nivea]
MFVFMLAATFSALLFSLLVFAAFLLLPVLVFVAGMRTVAVTIRLPLSSPPAWTGGNLCVSANDTVDFLWVFVRFWGMIIMVIAVMAVFIVVMMIGMVMVIKPLLLSQSHTHSHSQGTHIIE